MEEITPRLDREGKPVQDSPVNEKAAERRKQEAAQREKAAADAAAPWSREKIQRELDRLSAEGPLGTVNGKELYAQLVLDSANLAGLDLSGMDLARANMYRANLTGANLSGCRLVEANLSEALLTGAVLERVNAVEATFHGACLCSSKASKAQFMGANMSECCIESVDGMDVVEKPLTPAEIQIAKHKQAEGFKVDIRMDESLKGEAKALYFGEVFERANVHNMVTACKRKAKS